MSLRVRPKNLGRRWRPGLDLVNLGVLLLGAIVVRALWSNGAESLGRRTKNPVRSAGHNQASFCPRDLGQQLMRGRWTTHRRSV